MCNSKKDLTTFIKNRAKELGFIDVGISRTRHLAEWESRLRSWLGENKNGGMQYMENHFEKRLDPRLLVEGSRSVITVLLNYYPEKENLSKSNFKISKYAYGKDYHTVIKDKLFRLLEEIEGHCGRIRARAFSDSAPVMDKVWAHEAGLGWMGKNTCLINKEAGSFFFIGHLITDLELEYDEPFKKDHCGTCDRCIKACPTGAITAPYKLDARKCISYSTIENRDEFADETGKKLDQWIFGCDICQDVCHWNKRAVPHQEEEFMPSDQLLMMQKDDWYHLTEEIYYELFKHSAISRVTYKNLMRNIRAVAIQHE